MIFGLLHPKFQIPGGNFITLEHANIEPSWMQPNLIEHQSVLNGHREWVKVSDEHAEFVITVNLHKYDSAENKFRELLLYRNTEVYFHPHSDAGAIRDANGDKVLFRIVEMTPFYNFYDEAYVHYDAIIIKFRSKDPVDYEQSINVPDVLGQKDGSLITDKSGKGIRIKKGPAKASVETPNYGGDVESDL